MSAWKWVLIGEFVLSAFLLTWKSAAGSERKYGPRDLILGLPEMAFLTWIVVTRL